VQWFLSASFYGKGFNPTIQKPLAFYGKGFNPTIQKPLAFYLFFIIILSFLYLFKMIGVFCQKCLFYLSFISFFH
jgi:hypothetical protein